MSSAFVIAGAVAIVGIIMVLLLPKLGKNAA
jgi:hypothetical protein